MDTIELHGHRYQVSVDPDPDAGAPWEECDGHGVVTDWAQRAKRPGERVLANDRHWHRYYDIAASTRIARRDGWGLDAERTAALARRLGRIPTRRDIASEAVDQDYRFLRGWCNDEWAYHIVTVTDPTTDEYESMGWVEGYDPDHVGAVIAALACDLERRLHQAAAPRPHDLLAITRALLR
jgi:hypothetical protein